MPRRWTLVGPFLATMLFNRSWRASASRPRLKSRELDHAWPSPEDKPIYLRGNLTNGGEEYRSSGCDVRADVLDHRAESVTSYHL